MKDVGVYAAYNISVKYRKSFFSVFDPGEGAASDEPSHSGQPGSGQERSPAAQGADLRGAQRGGGEV